MREEFGYSDAVPNSGTQQVLQGSMAISSTVIKPKKDILIYRSRFAPKK